MSKPAHKPTKIGRKFVETLSGYGLKYEAICKHPDVACGMTTLHKYYRKELDAGNSAALGKIGEALYTKAMAGDTTLLIFLGKTRLGLSELNRVHVDNTSSDGSMGASASAVLAILSAKHAPDDAG